MSMKTCQICNTAQFKYTCPRCNVIYCSLSCYKSEGHLKCSEEFYKQCIQDELASSSENDYKNDDLRKMYNILKRMREAQAGLEIEDFQLDGLDSDDDQNESSILDNDEDIAERLKDIDINDADEVWEKLSLFEKEEFKRLVSSGDIMKLIPDFKPWWLEKENSKIIVLSSNEKKRKSDVPKIFDNIAKFSDICSKTPAPCLHYNLWNILAAYSCTVRYFNGEHLTNPNEASAYLVNLSSTLKYGTNFEDVEDALISVEMEALTTGNSVNQLLPTTGVLLADRTRLKADSRLLMSTLDTKLSALSDILTLLSTAKNNLKRSSRGDAEFQKLFALSSGMEELTHPKLKKISKKIEFYLSYVNRENNLSL